MYTTINGIYDNGHIILEEAPPTKKRMKVLITFVEDSSNKTSNEANIEAQKPAEQDKLKVLKQGFSERWQGQFKLNDKTGDERFDYLKQRYQL
ncbi:hypothetical protein V3O24_15415 [Methylobacter sp. Wu8]|uniref:hypothetical protein n=1 Tax=Methylobacter sp. Wu8 TaxID=3118457 RepID=UPI002F307D7A